MSSKKDAKAVGVEPLVICGLGRMLQGQILFVNDCLENKIRENYRDHENCIYPHRQGPQKVSILEFETSR